MEKQEIEKQCLELLLTHDPLTRCSDPQGSLLKWLVAYPAEDILQWLKDIVAYSGSNPTWGKQRKDFSRTVGKWFRRNWEKRQNLNRFSETGKEIKGID